MNKILPLIAITVLAACSTGKNKLPAVQTQTFPRRDIVVTSGLDGIFPRGLLVGTVSNVDRKRPGLFLNVQVTPAVDFRRLEQVLVVTQMPPKVPAQAKG